MRKFNNLLKKVYGTLMTVSFFGGIVPLIPFVVAIAMGGTAGEAIALFLYEEFYPWIIAIGSIAVLVGLVSIYTEKLIPIEEKSSAEEVN